MHLGGGNIPRLIQFHRVTLETGMRRKSSLRSMRRSAVMGGFSGFGRHRCLLYVGAASPNGPYHSRHVVQRSCRAEQVCTIKALQIGRKGRKTSARRTLQQVRGDSVHDFCVLVAIPVPIVNVCYAALPVVLQSVHGIPAKAQSCNGTAVGSPEIVWGGARYSQVPADRTHDDV